MKRLLLLAAFAATASLNASTASTSTPNEDRELVEQIKAKNNIAALAELDELIKKLVHFSRYSTKEEMAEARAQLDSIKARISNVPADYLVTRFVQLNDKQSINNWFHRIENLLVIEGFLDSLDIWEHSDSPDVFKRSIFRTLLDNGADINAPNDQGLSFSQAGDRQPTFSGTIDNFWKYLLENHDPEQVGISSGTWVPKTRADGKIGYYLAPL